MRYRLLMLLVVLTTAASAQNDLKKIWESDSTTVKGPESVLFDPMSGSLLISSMNTGEVYRMTPQGKIAPKALVKGLQSNKGSAFYKGKFYTAETSGVAVVNLASGQIIKRIPVQGAVMLNDLAIDDQGTIYVTDTRTGKVYKISGGQVTLFLDNIPGANGLLTFGSDVYVLGSTTIFKVDARKHLDTVARGFESGLDGIVRISDTTFIASNYHGILYLVKSNGDKSILLDTRSRNIMSNDISYDPSTHILYAPAFRTNRVIAYQVQ